jgi:hypothetical protein
VIFAREFPVSRLDLIGGCTATDAEHLVVISRLDCHRASFLNPVQKQD